MTSYIESIFRVPQIISYCAFSVLNKLNLRSIGGIDLGQYVYMDPGSEVIDGIFIGSLSTATNQAWLQQNDIGAIINLSGTHYESSLPVMELIMDDTDVDCEKMPEYLAKFDHGVEGIKVARAHGKRILIHCAAGINRSATLIAFYLIESGFDYATTIRLLTEANNRRNTPVLTNPSFRYMLCARDAFNRTFDKKYNMITY